MKTKRGAIILLVIVVLFIASIFYRNVTTYNSMKKNPGYTWGLIIKVWDDGSWYSRYQYIVNERVYQGRQGGKHQLDDTVLIVYDTTKPGISMITKYPLPIILDSSNHLAPFDTTVVRFMWADYLPGDEIHSIGDLWSLE